MLELWMIMDDMDDHGVLESLDWLEYIGMMDV